MSKKNVKGFAAGRVYAITPPNFELADFLPTLEGLLGEGGVCCLQLRLKAADGTTPLGEKMADYAPKLKAVCRKFRVPLVVNDRPRGAIDCDGFHLGDDDRPHHSLGGADAGENIVGVSCQNDIEKALAVAELGASYVAFGAFFPTATKPNAVSCPVSLLDDWQQRGNIAAVAIGGITADNCGGLAAADYLAVCSYLWSDPDGAPSALNRLKDNLKN